MKTIYADKCDKKQVRTSNLNPLYLTVAKHAFTALWKMIWLNCAVHIIYMYFPTVQMKCWRKNYVQGISVIQSIYQNLVPFFPPLRRFLTIQLHQILGHVNLLLVNKNQREEHRSLYTQAHLRSKSQKKKQTDKTKDLTSCPCNKVYMEDDDWLPYDLCDVWYDRQCLNINDSRCLK